MLRDYLRKANAEQCSIPPHFSSMCTSIQWLPKAGNTIGYVPLSTRSPSGSQSTQACAAWASLRCPILKMFHVQCPVYSNLQPTTDCPSTFIPTRVCSHTATLAKSLAQPTLTTWARVASYGCQVPGVGHCAYHGRKRAACMYTCLHIHLHTYENPQGE